MYDNIFFSLLLNVGLLVLVAATLTKIPVVRRMLVDGNQSPGTKAALALIFGLISIFSTYTGIRTHDAIVNTRVIGVVAAGLLGGPAVGIGAAVIAGFHRYLFDIGGFTAFSCAISTLVEGFIGAYFSRHFQKNNYSSIGIFAITVFAEICQMLIILVFSKPFTAAWALVEIISAPMILLNAFGMVVFIGTFRMVFLEETNEYAEKMQLALHIADQSLPHLRKGLYSQSDMEATVSIIYDALTCCGVLITDLNKVLARKENPKADKIISAEILGLVMNAAKSRSLPLQMDESSTPFALSKGYHLIAAPLNSAEEPAGCLIVLSKKQWNNAPIGTAFVKELANLFSSQLELGNLEYQKRMLKKAELRALQAQVNPHFLYNALNTISTVCRENPERARELLRALSSYYRQTLENERYTLNLHTEIYQVNLYLELEKARFEEKLQVSIQIPDDTDCPVPAFILQPLVENAIHYGADREGIRFVEICARVKKDHLLICVTDHGPGIPADVMEHLKLNLHDKGYGLLNTHRRLKSIYGKENGLVIDNTPGRNVVSFAVPIQHDGDQTELNTGGNTDENSRNR